METHSPTLSMHCPWAEGHVNVEVCRCWLCGRLRPLCFQGDHSSGILSWGWPRSSLHAKLRGFIPVSMEMIGTPKCNDLDTWVNTFGNIVYIMEEFSLFQNYIYSIYISWSVYCAIEKLPCDECEYSVFSADWLLSNPLRTKTVFKLWIKNGLHTLRLKKQRFAEGAQKVKIRLKTWQLQ